MPELSIIVPVYKVENYLPRCVDSILAQTFTDLELILIDDGSPDRCGEICDEYAAKDCRIKVIHQQNQGVSAARNAGLDIAKGTYLGFVDSDDWIEPEMFGDMFLAMRQHRTELVICGINYCSEEGIYLRSDLTADSVLSRDELLKDLYGKPNPIGGGCVNKLFLRDRIQQVRFNPKLKIAEDWVFLFDCFRLLNNAYHMPKAYYNVTERADSATRRNEADACYDLLFEGKSSLLLLRMARDYSHELECFAMDKYMDDCLRFSNIIRKYGKKEKKPYRLKFLRIRFQILKRIPQAIRKKLLPKEKIRGYLYSVIRT